MNKVEFGRKAEAMAVKFLLENGYAILDKNYRKSFGEIDIIAQDGDVLCFIEVKAREGDLYGHPFEAVTISKQKTIRKVAQMYLMESELGEQFLRFDVIGIQFQGCGEPIIELQQNAF